MRRVAILLALLLATSACGFTGDSIVARPYAASEWADEDRVPPVTPCPSLVAVFQATGLISTQLGSGSIVHSCREHGTFVLTALHCVDEERTPGVWISDPEHGRDKGDARRSYDELRCYETSLVIPGPRPEGLPGEIRVLASKESLLAEVDRLLGRARAVDESDPGARPEVESIRSRLEWIEFLISYDFAVLRVKTKRTFEPIALPAETAPVVTNGESVELAATHPEGYPHRHPFTWGDTWPETVFQHGHSGGPILYRGALVAIIAQGVTATRRVTKASTDRPPIEVIRKVANEKGMPHLLDPEARCGGTRRARD
jgi:hypothetical protein